MKQITLFALLLWSTISFSQVTKIAFEDSKEPPTYLNVIIYDNLDSVKKNLLKKKEIKLVSHSGNTLVLESKVLIVTSTLVFKSNPTNNIVYFFSWTITSDLPSGMTPYDAYQEHVNQIISGSTYYPYNQNENPELGDIYSKWLFNDGTLTVKINQYGKVVTESERIYGQDVIDYINSLKVKK